MDTGVRVVRTRAPYVLARAVAATVVAVVGALAAHTWAGGTVPTGPGLTLVAAVVLAGGLLLFTREVPIRALLPVVAAAQLGLHESFGLVAEHGHESGLTGMAGMSGMVGTSSPSAADAAWSWQMVAAHLFVTLLTAFLWWTGRRAASYVVALLLVAAPPVAARPRPRPGDVRLGASLVRLLVPPGRGPPPGVLPA